MENLNAEQIVIEIQGLIKALKANNGWWENRGRGGWFNHDILVDAVAVITSQEQRIKELTESYNSLEAHYLKVRDESLAENKRLTEENEKLLNEFESAPLGRFEFEILYKEKCTQLDVANRRIVELLADKEFSKINRTEFKKMIVSEMQERLKAYFGTYVLGYKILLSEALKAVNQIAKEMLEGENSVQRCKVEIENRKEVRECACGARFSAFVADKTDVMCAKCKHERGETANEDIE